MSSHILKIEIKSCVGPTMNFKKKFNCKKYNFMTGRIS
ncbi:hypothetical protein LEP1GSC021_4336 [Leptospira noguchii str. 1993005606]|uniref:Uncharacterized protein n=1 Tax=Leptospira noguchii str. 2007001578 TaxID=1049974 RepID=A0ABP2T5L3_9LEPT|nr:hypothetical protein LEP1GSC035_0601 [Leptospira noguchii str. 2007001578]EPE86143.1 hypothetical protein LEP1GSC021_4336 [Leptospira noguchii str. 1993005606]